MTRYVIGRVGQFAIVVVGATILVFAILRVVAEPAVVALPDGTEEQRAEFEERYGLDEPVLTQLGDYLGSALQGDFGESIWLGEDALTPVLERLPATLMLALPATIFAGVLGVAVGARAARLPRSKFTSAANVLSYVFISVAEFWLGIMLILLLAVNLGWLPTGGYQPKPSVLVMPILVLSLRPFAHHFQLAQATMREEYQKKYVLAARAKGVREGAVARRHILRNIAVPLMSLQLYELSRVFVGATVIVEIVFGWPGIGSLAINALQHGDIFLVSAIAVVAATVTAALNLGGDLFFFAVDPRTRHLVKGNAE